MVAIPTGLGWGAIRSALGGVPWQVYAGVFLLAAFPVTYCAGDRNGVKRERAANESEVERIRAEREALAIVVAEQDAVIAAASNQTIEERRKELDDATANIPDQALTDRQRARICSERLRAGQRCEFPATASASSTD